MEKQQKNKPLLLLLFLFVYSNTNLNSQITYHEKEGICELIFIKKAKCYQLFESIFTDNQDGEKYRYFDADVLRDFTVGYESDEFFMDSTEIALSRKKNPLWTEHFYMDTCEIEPNSLDYLVRKHTKPEPDSYFQIILNPSIFWVKNDTLKVFFKLSGRFLVFSQNDLYVFGTLQLNTCENREIAYKKIATLLCGNVAITNEVKPKGFKKLSTKFIFKLFACIWT